VKKLLLVLIFIGMTLVATAYWLNTYSRSAGDTQFSTSPIERGLLVEAISATGILQPQEVIAVGSPLSGEVVKIFDDADFNKVVAKGQPLLQLDDRAAKLKQDYSAVTVELARKDVQTADAAVDAAKTAVKRAKELVEKAVIKQAELDQAEAQLKLAETKRATAQVKVKEAEQGLRAAELEVTLTTVRAPAAGVIIDKKVVRGQTVAPPASAQLFTIATDLKHLRINAQIAEGDIGKVQAGLKATFTVYPYPDKTDVFEGTVKETRLLATNVQGAVFFPAIIEVENRLVPVVEQAASLAAPEQARPLAPRANEWMLRPGMTATIDIQRRKHENAWKMPNAALNFQLEEGYQTPEAKARLDQWKSRPDHDDWKYVWVLKNKKPWPLFVRIGGKDAQGDTGIRDGQYTEVLEWDPNEEANFADAAHLPEVIIAAPPVNKPGLFDKPSLKLS
jgi:HlyD family secretion protein